MEYQFPPPAAHTHSLALSKQGLKLKPDVVGTGPDGEQVGA
jgi:hypothetical protein